MHTRFLLALILFFAEAVEAHPARGFWTSIQGNGEHTGYLNIQADLSKLQKAWSLALNDDEFFLKPPLVSENMVYFHLVRKPKNQLFPFVRAVDIQTGSPIWEKEIDFDSSLFYHDGELFVQSSTLYSYNGETGDFNYVVPLSEGRHHHFGVCKTKEALIAVSGKEIQSFNPKTLALSWQREEEQNVAFQEPAINNSYIAETTTNGMSIFNAKSGALIANIACSCYLNNSEFTHVPVLDAKNGLVYNCFKDEDSWEPYLYAFDLKTNSVKWQSRNQFGQPAVADDVLYINSYTENGFNALEAATGKPLWSWELAKEEDILKGWPGPVVTNNLLFVQGNLKTYALDRKTGQNVWATDATGYMALGQKILIIGGDAFWFR